MKPLYALLRERCGLSIREAAAFHDVSENTVVSWSAGRRNPPESIAAELRALYRQIETAAVTGRMSRLPSDGPKDAARGLAAIRTVD